MQTPTYSATDIKRLCLTLPVEYNTFKLMTELIEEELHLYSDEDLVILIEASMIMFARCMLVAGLGCLKKI